MVVAKNEKAQLSYEEQIEYLSWMYGWIWLSMSFRKQIYTIHHYFFAVRKVSLSSFEEGSGSRR